MGKSRERKERPMYTDLLSIFSELPELIYISDAETYDMLYVNKASSDAFSAGNDVFEQRTPCYRYLQGFDAPCPFCNIDQLSEDKTICWEHTNPLTGRHYLLRDRLIRWEGRPARVEIAFDITEKEEERTQLKQLVDIDRAVMNCVARLDSAQDIPTELNRLVATIGTAFSAERAYLFQVRGDRIDNTCEWCAPGVSPRKDRMQSIAVDDEYWGYRCFQLHEPLVVDDIEPYRESWPLRYDEFKRNGLERVIVAPFEMDGAFAGFIGVENMPDQDLSTLTVPLMSLAYFISSKMKRVKILHQLRHLSFSDELTDTQNRNAFLHDIGETRADLNRSCRQFDQVGVVFVDVNRLKDMNDTQGHEAGDELLKQVARILATMFGHESLYRIGGDEFAVLQEHISQEDFERGVEAAQRALVVGGVSLASVGSHWMERCNNIRELLRKADERMFEAKRVFHEEDSH